MRYYPRMVQFPILFDADALGRPNGARVACYRRHARISLERYGRAARLRLDWRWRLEHVSRRADLPGMPFMLLISVPVRGTR